MRGNQPAPQGAARGRPAGPPARLAGLSTLAVAVWLFTGSAPRAEDGAGADPAQPVLAIRDAVFNWGKAFKGEQLEHSYTIENTGKAVLEIRELKPSCGCMSVASEPAYKQRLAPGEKTTILLHIDTRTLEPGQVKNKYTEVLTNALEGENRLSIEGEIEELFRLTPSHPALDVVRGGPPPEPYRFTLATQGERRVSLGALTPRKGLVKATLKEAEKGHLFEVVVEPTLKDMKTVFQSEDLEAKLEVDGKPIPFLVQVAIKLKDRIDVEPSQSVYFRRAETAKAGGEGAPKLVKTLEIVSIGGSGHTFRVTGATVQNKVFSAAVETVEPGKRYRLSVTLQKMPASGERFLKDLIEVSTDDPEVPKLKIPASAQF
ncbi:MAG TPA: DUF1573 domain-containing protein [Planctomycetota bacterium]|nr:DUF1573 domain-containing protein [Planctomycetota bacterium]